MSVNSYEFFRGLWVIFIDGFDTSCFYILCWYICLYVFMEDLILKMIWTAIVTFESRIILESFNFCNTISLEQLFQNFRRVNFIKLLRVKCQVAFVFYRFMYLYPVFSCIFSDFFFFFFLNFPALYLT